MRRGLVVVSLLSALVFSCKTIQNQDSNVKADASPPKLGLGLNDLSVLLPRNTVENFDSALPGIEDANGDDRYLPADAFDAMNAALKGSGVMPTREVHNGFKPSAIRFVPCANDLDVGAKLDLCVATMQVIWQTKDDRGMHTIYMIPKASFQKIVDTLRDLHASSSVDTEKLPLQVHPIIQKEGVKGPYFQALMKIFNENARVSRMIGFATMQSDNFTVWSMAQFKLNAGKSELLALPFNNVNVQAFSDQAARRRVLSVFPLAPVSIPNIPFGDGGLFGPVPPAAEVARVKALRVKNSFLIDNPGLHNIRNMDCAGCHSSNFTIADRTTPFTAPSDRFQSTHWDLTASDVGSPSKVNALSLQMFSYERSSSGRPKITQRVVNETAVALEYLIKLGYVKAPANWATATAPVEASSSFKAGQIITLISRLSSKCLDLTDGNKTDKGLYQVWDCQANNQNQQFQVESVKGNQILLKNVASALCLDLAAVPSQNGTRISQAACGKRDAQQFVFEASDTGFFTVKTNNASKCLTIADDSKANGAKVQTWDCLKKANEQWKPQAI